MKETVFFAKEGEKGLNETSASHLCALASQVKAQDESTVENIRFVDTTLSIVGQKGEHITDTGYKPEGLNELQDILARIAKMNAFISWFAEARKALECYKTLRLQTEIQEWAEMMGKTIPESPKDTSEEVTTSTLEDIMNEMSIKDRQTYLSLEAKSAVYGKFIHPKQPFETARANLHRIVNSPYMTTGSGRDTLIYHFEPSVPTKQVDDMFNKLQAEYRRTEQSLNHMKSDLRKKIDVRLTEENNERRIRLQKFNEENQQYQDKMSNLTLEYNQWLVEEQTRLSKIKLVIPDDLLDTKNWLESLAK